MLDINFYKKSSLYYIENKFRRIMDENFVFVNGKVYKIDILNLQSGNALRRIKIFEFDRDHYSLRSKVCIYI
jgi:hypothetical protein